MKELSINLKVAGRFYKLKVNSREEEERVRLAAKQINEKIDEFEDAYQLKDKQDLLAMVSLFINTRYLKAFGDEEFMKNDLMLKVQDLINLIESNI